MLLYSSLITELPTSSVTPSVWWLQSEEPIRRIVRPVRLDETPAPTIVVLSPAPNMGWILDEPTRRITRPSRLDNVVDPIFFSSGVHHRWSDETTKPPLRRQLARLDETAAPIFFSSGVHHRWLDETARPLPRRRTVSLDETAWVPFLASMTAPPSCGWFPSDQHAIRRKFARLDEITVPLGETLPAPPTAPPWFMQSEQPQAPKARWIANVGPCLWTVVFQAPPPPPAVAADYIAGKRMIGWY